MSLTPIDIQQQKFRRAVRGYDRSDVENFLDLVAQQVSEQAQTVAELRGELRSLRTEVTEHKAREESFKQAMLTAQRAIDEMGEQAHKQAELVVSEAEVQAEKIMHNAHRKVNVVHDELAELRRQRTRFVEELRGILRTHESLLEVHLAHEGGGAGSGVDSTGGFGGGSGAVTSRGVGGSSVGGTRGEARIAVLERVRAPTPPGALDNGANRSGASVPASPLPASTAASDRNGVGGRAIPMPLERSATVADDAGPTASAAAGGIVDKRGAG